MVKLTGFEQMQILYSPVLRCDLLSERCGLCPHALLSQVRLILEYSIITVLTNTSYSTAQVQHCDHLCATPLLLAIIIARVNAYLRALATLRLSSTVLTGIRLNYWTDINSILTHLSTTVPNMVNHSGTPMYN